MPNSKKIVTIIGARPQFIKAAPLSRELRSRGEAREVLVHTGQHYDPGLSDIFFEELWIPKPDYHLGIGSLSHAAQTGRMLEEIEKVLVAERPDWLLVYGDTNSTLAGALAAVKLHVPVAHVEAGVRSFNRRMPEEINRVATDHVSTLLLAPTDTAVANLKNEGIFDTRVRRTGDIMLDAALHFGARAEKTSRVLDRLGVRRGEYVLSTIHRAENTDVPIRLGAIIQGLTSIARDIPVVLPLHPRTRSRLPELSAKGKFLVIDPVGYLDMVMLEKNAAVIATDSGGVQKEAFFHRVPCVTLRDETEWVELVEMGWNRLVDTRDVASITRTVISSVGQRGREGEPYGKGNAAAEITDLLVQR